MPELTLESLAARVAALERAAAGTPAILPPSRDLSTVVGMFEGNEVSKQIDAEVEALRAAERQALDEEAAA